MKTVSLSEEVKNLKDKLNWIVDAHNLADQHVKLMPTISVAEAAVKSAEESRLILFNLVPDILKILENLDKE